MEFVASLTREPSKLRKLFRLWDEGGDSRNPFANVLITPLFTHPRSLDMIREMRRTGKIKRLYFDSGGYFVQTGRIDYYEMYWQLLQFYRSNAWADWYVLPDYVPSSTDDTETTWFKVQETVQLSRQFQQEMPLSLKERAIPVVHGHSIEQVEYCLSIYRQMDVRCVGFGSFGTGGKSNSVNTLNSQALHSLSILSRSLAEDGIQLHAFGVGTPPVVYLLDRVGVYSFDSVGWMKTAGFGKVYMPFVRAHNITYVDKMAKGLTEERFNQLRAETGHTCVYCQSFEKLSTQRDLRIMHNLTVVLDTIDALNSERIPLLVRTYSPQYARLLEEAIL